MALASCLADVRTPLHLLLMGGAGQGSEPLGQLLTPLVWVSANSNAHGCKGQCCPGKPSLPEVPGRPLTSRLASKPRIKDTSMGMTWGNRQEQGRELLLLLMLDYKRDCKLTMARCFFEHFTLVISFGSRNNYLEITNSGQ